MTSYQQQIINLINIINQPVMDFDGLLRALQLFHINTTTNMVTFALTHLNACKKTVTDLCCVFKQGHIPIMSGILMSDWNMILQNIIFQNNFFHLLETHRSRELLFFIRLFKPISHKPLKLIYADELKSKAMIHLLTLFIYLTPQGRALHTWQTVEKKLQQKLPPKGVELVYAYLFLPPYLKKNFKNKLIDALPQNKFKSNSEKLNVSFVKKFLFIEKSSIDHENLLTYLFCNESYTLIDIFIAIIPFPWENIVGLMMSLTHSQQSFFLNTLQKYTINHNQFLSLLKLNSIKANDEILITQTEIQYWVDTCRDIYTKNIINLAKRQSKIDYVCKHPIGMHALEKMLIYFNKNVENPSDWLSSIYIDKYTIASNDVFVTKRILSKLSKNDISNHLIEKLFNPNTLINEPYMNLKTHFILRIKSMLLNYQNTFESILIKWFWAIDASNSHNGLLKALRLAETAFELETDFRKVISYMRYLIEKNYIPSFRKDQLLFNSINQIDLDCANFPSLGNSGKLVCFS